MIFFSNKTIRTTQRAVVAAHNCRIRSDTMGKKSKAAKAKAKTGVAPGAPSALGTGGGNSVGAGAMVISTSSKRQNCVRCFGTVRPDKGSACPGCAQLYCWRCEKKAFEECPNGSECVYPLRRCKLCAEGHTLRTVLEEEGADFQKNPFERFQRYIVESDALSLRFNYFLQCSDCPASECVRCCRDPILRRLRSCGSCGTSRCHDCNEEKTKEMCRSSNFIELLCEALEPGRFSEVVGELKDLMRSSAPGAMSICKTCNDFTCNMCMDDKSMESLLKAFINPTPQDAGKSLFQCSHCYWSAKPCTNPTCPNEVGVPTKRCGGCHIDRYCSIDCQAAAYPSHVARCQKIQAKRAAAASEEAGAKEEATDEDMSEWWDDGLIRALARGRDDDYYEDAIGCAYREEKAEASRKPWY